MSTVTFADESLALAVLGQLIQLGRVPPFDIAAWRAAHPASEDPARSDAIDWRAAEDELGESDREEDGGEDYRHRFGSRAVFAEARAHHVTGHRTPAPRARRRGPARQGRLLRVRASAFRRRRNRWNTKRRATAC
jgi:hypothetical protein